MINCVTYNDLAAIGTLITAIATVWLAIATYSMAQEMKRGREQSSMPRLVLFPDKRFYLFRNLNDYQYWYWHENSLQDEKLIESTINRTFYLDLFNIGVGCAKDVRFNYVINKSEMISFFNVLGIVSNINLELEKDALSFNAKYGSDPLGINVSKIDMNFKHAFIPKSDEKPFKIKLPMIYLALFNGFLLSILDKPKNWEFFDKFPSILLFTSYEDIANKAYNKNFRVTLKIDSMAIDIDKVPSHVSGVIKIDEII